MENGKWKLGMKNGGKRAHANCSNWKENETKHSSTQENTTQHRSATKRTRTNTHRERIGSLVEDEDAAGIWGAQNNANNDSKLQTNFAYRAQQSRRCVGGSESVHCGSQAGAGAGQLQPKGNQIAQRTSTWMFSKTIANNTHTYTHRGEAARMCKLLKSLNASCCESLA